MLRRDQKEAQYTWACNATYNSKYLAMYRNVSFILKLVTYRITDAHTDRIWFVKPLLHFYFFFGLEFSLLLCSFRIRCLMCVVLLPFLRWPSHIHLTHITRSPQKPAGITFISRSWTSLVRYAAAEPYHPARSEKQSTRQRK